MDYILVFIVGFLLGFGLAYYSKTVNWIKGFLEIFIKK